MGGCPPINSVYVQYPNTKSPEEIWFLTTWELLDYGGAFFRSSGGNAKTFNGGLQSDSVKSHKHAYSNSISIWGKGGGLVSQGSNNMSTEGDVFWELVSPIAGRFSGGTGDQIVRLGINATKSFSGDTDSNNTDAIENRPNNYTMQIWKRLS